MENIIITSIAMICHEANRAYCQAIGDYSQVSWAEATGWQQQSAIKHVQFILDNPGAFARESHESWLKEKAEKGWKYGPVKDAGKLEHPCFVPYAELPKEQQRKDALFAAIVDSLRPWVKEAEDAAEKAKSEPVQVGPPEPPVANVTAAEPTAEATGPMPPEPAPAT